MTDARWAQKSDEFVHGGARGADLVLSAVYNATFMFNNSSKGSRAREAASTAYMDITAMLRHDGMPHLAEVVERRHGAIFKIPISNYVYPTKRAHRNSDDGLGAINVGGDGPISVAAGVSGLGLDPSAVALKASQDVTDANLFGFVCGKLCGEDLGKQAAIMARMHEIVPNNSPAIFAKVVRRNECVGYVMELIAPAYSMSIPDKLYWLESLLETMHALHSEGIVHGDPSFANAMAVRKGGTVVACMIDPFDTYGDTPATEKARLDGIVWAEMLRMAYRQAKGETGSAACLRR